MKDNLEQIKECRSGANKHGYLTAHEVADIWLQEGQAQVYCLLCQRWRWLNNLCGNAIAASEPPIIDNSGGGGTTAAGVGSTDPIAREWDTPEEDEAWKEL